MSNDATTYIRRAGRRDAIPTRVLVRAGAREAGRLIRHPLHIAGWLLLIAVSWNWPPVAFKYDPYSDVPLEMTALVGIPTFLAASRLATRPRRTGAEESLSSLPTGPETRWAISLTAAVGPFALSLPAMAFLWQRAHTWVSGSAMLPPQYIYQCAAGPLSVLGAGLLAVLVARWFPWPLVPAVVLGCLIAITLFGENGPVQWFTPYVPNDGALSFVDPRGPLNFGPSRPATDVTFVGELTRCSRTRTALVPGHGGVCSMPWHVSYLFGLDLLVIVGIFFVGRFRWYAIAAGLPLLALITAAALQQLR